MRGAPSIKLTAYLALAAAGSIAGLSAGRAELIALVAPFAAYVALGLALARRPRVTVRANVEQDVVLEGEEVSVVVRIVAETAVDDLELELRPTRGFVTSATTRRALQLAAGQQFELRFLLRPQRWGGARLGEITCQARDRFGLFVYQLPDLSLATIRVFPRIERLRELVGPLELQATAGSRVSQERGEGIEFAEVRPFTSGDRVRRINWRVTARRAAPYVSERHPERNADVILFLDTFADVRDARGSTLELAVRAAASLAHGYLARKDRVGVIGFGGMLNGLGPRLGTAQLYRILDSLIGSEVTFSYTHKDVRFVPRRLLPPKALVIAITPLIDKRSLAAMLDLRARGFDLAVLDISPVPFTAPGSAPSDRLAHRLWVLQRDALRTRIQALGVPVTEWGGEEPLQVPLATGSALRRRARHPVSL
jgi:uncharacterized protein (DUF58 family)